MEGTITEPYLVSHSFPQLLLLVSSNNLINYFGLISMLINLCITFIDLIIMVHLLDVQYPDYTSY